MNKIALRHFALINATARFLFVFSSGTANASGSPDQEGDIHPNLAADGVTSDDVTLAKAAAACDKAGTRLVLPAGKILLTGAATVVLNHCAMMGVGAPAGDRTGEYGTTILLTSETVPPFQLETGWQISGINFYWPNQSTGKTPYPPLFSDGGKSRGFNHGIINNIVIVNAYDGMTTTPGGGSGDVKISNSTMWAYHYLFNLTNTGDSWAFSNNRFTPGPLLSKCGFSLSCEAAINEANHVNALFHITAGRGVTLVVSSTETFSWRYGILIDSGALVGGSIFDVAWDGVGTLIDSSSGGKYAFQNNFTGSMSQCNIVVYGGIPTEPAPCFNLGIGSGLFIHDFRTDGSLGSWLLGAGGNTVEMNNVSIATIGGANDGRDYYIVHFAAPTNTLIVRNSQLRGLLANSHVHGIDIETNTMGNTIIQNCVFNSLNDSIIGTTNNRVVVTGNTSFNTNPSGRSVDLRGTGKMVYVGNYWDVPPTALLPIISN
ncbi:MAG TPA: hypothetical protein VF783_24325 [Terriglobales bacterium]